MNNITKEDIIRKIQEIREKNISKTMINLLNTIEKFVSDNVDEINNYETSTIRYCDYFDLNFHEQEIIDSFEESYQGSNRDDHLMNFIIYCIFRNMEEILEIYELGLEYEECTDLEKCLKNTIFDVTFLIDFYYEKKSDKLRDKVDMSFISDNKYGIFFAGLANKDIRGLQKQELKALIKKLKGELSTSDIVRDAERIEHVKESYDVHMLRIQFSDDYRLAFIRNNKMTIILGVDVKSGKDLNYTRYDSVARRIDEIYKEVEDYINGKLSSEATHFKVVKYLEDFLRKEKKVNNQYT